MHIIMYVLYGGRFTRALIVEMVMAEGGIDHELRPVDLLNQEHRSAEFLAISPTGQIPVMITPAGQTLYETPAINLYLAERHGLTQLAPGIDESARALFLRGLFYVTDELEPVMKRYFYPHRYVLRPEDTAAARQRALSEALERLAIIDEHLHGGGPYYLGQRFSLVDLTLAYWTAYIEREGMLESYPNVKRCLRLVMERPKVRPKFDELTLMTKEYSQKQLRGEDVK